ncbi:MAG: thiol:disulfide interchange protein DsbA/DsbL [Pseudomonadales bacterium]|nr:thiol:disulfide interchange protein DsbA/DsbL [Halieaceae bacterium]MCP5163647.1 thiol:disulfide interchange protein DsbA/DsbL [Pseudomonadales bacterium]MCP5189271.1 thiol:disulfide interchange protein DsbA/DsbL [Pseudomonadales bacterium]MCP5204469.1 thiol:disulfide interchange protein DsbA/DsbL [Pseudomonadales bacterium]
MRNKLLLTLTVLVFAPLMAMAQAGQDTFKEGENYDLISPALRTGNPDKVEVVEFFWYGCGHCYTFEPLIEAWEKNLAEDVEFHGSPAMWSPPMELHARAYYTAQALGVLDTMNKVLFQAMNVDGKRLASKDEIQALFVANGVEAEAFSRAFDSFGVSSQVKQADARARTAKISGTPSMMVNGKYLITARKAGSQAGMLEVVDFLIEKERAAGSGQQP